MSHFVLKNHYCAHAQNYQKIAVLTRIKLQKCTSWNYSLTSVFFGCQQDRPVLLLPGSWWSGYHEAELERPKLTRRARCKQCAQCRVVKELDKDFHKMHLGQGGKCKACKGGGQTINLKPQQPLIDMIFTYVVDPRCAGRLDDKQGGDTLVTIKRVKKEIALKSAIRSSRTSQHDCGSHRSKRAFPWAQQVGKSTRRGQKI